MKLQSADFFEILRVFSQRNVEFIVVGGVCGVLHGAPITTFDLDVVYATNATNTERLLSVLEDLDGRSRLHQRKIKPNKSHFEAGGHLLLQTRLGPLDLLGSIGNKHKYDELFEHTVEGVIRDVSFRMLNLQTLIRTKEEVGREKDKFVLPILRATLSQQR